MAALLLRKVIGPGYIRLLSAFDAPAAEGLGAVAFEGRMIDLPVVNRARRLLERAAAWN